MRLSRRHVESAATPVEFTFDGRRLPALAGETIAAALAASGIAAIRRFDGGARDETNWRGLYCGMGACYDCVVTVDGRAGQRACLTKITGGETVSSSQPTGTAGDKLAPLAEAPEDGHRQEAEVDVLVVGAGPAGMAAALAAKRCGAAVVVLDERAQAGGQYYKPLAPSLKAKQLPDRQFRHGAEKMAALEEAGVALIQGALVWGAIRPDEVMTLVAGREVVYRPKKLILATGAYERPYPIPGWTLPGVMTTGAAQTLARAYGVSPGQRVVVAGNGPLNLQLASDLAAHGVTVVAVVESAPRPGLRQWRSLAEAALAAPELIAEGARYRAMLARHGTRMLWGHAAVAAGGPSQLKTVTVAPLGTDGRADAAQSMTLEADALCLGYGFIASTEIGRALGCETVHDPRHLGTAALRISENGETSLAGVYAVGDGAHVAGSRVAEAMGAIAGAHAAEALGFGGDAGATQPARRGLATARRFQSALWDIFAAPPVDLSTIPNETILCRCEGLTFGRIRAEIDAGWDSLGTLKRRTRLGMGRCQARYCATTAARLIEERTGRPRPVDGFAPRLPVKPFPAAALARQKPEWGGHARAGSPNLSRAPMAEPFGEIEAEIVVIGGGVVGACLALEFARAGKDVLVVERDDVNLQASGANAGSLHVQLLSFDFGKKAEAGGGPAADTLPLGPYAVKLWQEIAEACGGDFEIRVTGGLMVAETEAGMAFLKAKAEVERRHGIKAEILGRSELRDLAPGLSEDLIGAEYVAEEGKINPLTATYRTFEAAKAAGARSLRGTNVTAIERNGAAWTITTSRGTIRAGTVINAAGPWAREIGAMVGLDVPVYSAPLQMITTERAPALVGQLVAHADRHLSLKQLSTGGILIGGAWPARYAEHQRLNTTMLDSIEGNLWVAQRVVPQIAGLHVLRSWAGMNVNIDGAPIVGEAPGRPGFYNCVTSNGYTLAPAVARLTRELLTTGKASFDVAPYRLERFEGSRP
ncbi:FAD-dependent oxidoreductase [Jiella pelagia]|uniref:FAD-dependent oxidoreductase n=1 Tax=Jiella pelagia TaxID=2986949 RepID=A0ABY7BUD5_9HYPH|nr:FAD-dependent oxidoreductase [Jiella pelagia]WAP66912.1 FAD-dependent oxidoreductase [Jiella pelagia]